MSEVVVTEVPMPSDSKYMTVADGLRANALRHFSRAEAHLAAGRPDWAVGSILKAARNAERAERLELII